MNRHSKISKYAPSVLQGKIDFTSVAEMSFGGERSLERLTLRILVVFVVFLACTYLYFVTASVLHVMARREALSRIDAVQGSIGSLEQQYFSLSQGITPDVGQTIGLAPAQKTSYVYRPGTIGSATIVRNEI
jgi:hypothetical protein